MIQDVNTAHGPVTCKMRVSEAADYIGVKPRTVYKWLNEDQNMFDTQEEGRNVYYYFPQTWLDMKREEARKNKEKQMGDLTLAPSLDDPFVIELRHEFEQQLEAERKKTAHYKDELDRLQHAMSTMPAPDMGEVINQVTLVLGEMMRKEVSAVQEQIKLLPANPPIDAETIKLAVGEALAEKLRPVQEQVAQLQEAQQKAPETPWWRFWRR